MKKISLIAVGLLSIVPVLKFYSFSNSSQSNITEIKQSNNFITYESEEAQAKYININGSYFDTEHRIYIDSTKDTYLPSVPKSDDFLIGKGNKDEWYYHQFEGISLNVLEYASSKEDFLNQYGFLTLSYQYNSNLWNEKDKWTYELKKNEPYKFNYYNLILSNSNKTTEIFYHTDTSHSSNERTKINLKLTWTGNILRINLELGVWYYWAWGSIYNHAAFIMLQNDNYSFYKSTTNNEEEVKFGSINNFSKFETNNDSTVKGLDEIDEKINRKAYDVEITSATNKLFVLSLQGYSGFKKINDTIYAVYITIIFFPLSLNVIDSSSILNKENISRELKTNYTNQMFSFIYSNYWGLTERTNSIYLGLEFSDITCNGVIMMPYIYS